MPKHQVVVPVAGDLDLDSTPWLAGELLAAVASGARSVVVDMRDVSFCDCCALNVLRTSSESAHDFGVRFSIQGPLAPVVGRLFQITGADQELPVHDGT
ncbi:STAS domain-containing protein [Streptomyces longispororuber]|uniref:STAS domain-containing protein n=1 Tax=Streptomyces longispororuber TaxID=68230 RepID=UPI0033C5BF7C